MAAAMETSRDGFILVSSSGRVIAANQRMADFFPAGVSALKPGSHLASLLRIALAGALSVAPGRVARRQLCARLMAIAAGPAEVRLADGRWLRLSGSNAADGGVLIICVDVTVSRRAAASLQEGLSLHEKGVAYREIVLQSLSQGICLYAPDATVRLANSRYSELMGIDPALPIPGATMRSLLAASINAGHHGERSLDTLEQACLALVARGKKQRLVLTLATGRLVAFDHIPMPDGGWLATFEDITERRQLEERAAFLARHDVLTRLPNRTMLGERLEQAIAAAGRGARFALLYLNLDHFKTINDTLGHTIADWLLRAVGERLSACVRETDFVCRLGGDEFAIIQAEISCAEDTAKLAHRIVQLFAAPFEADGHRINVAFSIGIVMVPDDGAQADTLLRNADAAMERAKRDGRGTYCLFECDMDARVQARRTMVLDLHRALADGAFELHYQPLVDVAAGRVTGFESLLRWHHPQGGMVSPAEFIPLAEETGLIVPIGDWVLHAACKAAAAWPVPVRVAVNVSPLQFKGGDVSGSVASALALSGLPPRRLELEITESALLTDSAATLDILRGLRAQGVRISMDDFGTGFSSLSYLRSFPFDKIKIDQSFVRDLETSSDSAAIVGAIVGLGRSLGMRVTAEGVETEGQLAHLRAAGCDEVQGYLFSRPRPGDEVAGIIERIDAMVFA
jgi:diguanylate cyclase (GGDEF)-like protein